MYRIDIFFFCWLCSAVQSRVCIVSVTGLFSNQMPLSFSVPERNKNVCWLYSLRIINGGRGRPVVMSPHLASFQGKKKAKQKLYFQFSFVDNLFLPNDQSNSELAL